MQIHSKILDVIMDDSEISWKAIIYELVRQEEMDLGDIDVSEIAQQYVKLLKEAKQMDLKVSGKVILAAAFLLKIKSVRLLDNSLDMFNKMMNPEDQKKETDEDDKRLEPRKNVDYTQLIPKIPQPRKRKVSVQDLINALEKALQVKERRVSNYIKKTEVNIDIPDVEFDISKLIDMIYYKVDEHYNTKQSDLYFHHLLPSQSPMDKVMYFLPLLHLENHGKIAMNQKEHLGDIHIKKRDKVAEALESTNDQLDEE